MKALDMILFWANMNYHPVYEQYLVEKYEEENGKHFNECYAKKVVGAMCSYDDNGNKRTGEHWSCEQVKTAISPFADILGKNDTDWDAYVAVNMWWHDLSCNYKRHFAERADEFMIEDALTWAFDDPDAEDGKLWSYFFHK